MKGSHWIIKRKQTTGLHLAHGAEAGKRAGILRKIVGTMKVNGMWYEQLECGHKGRLESSVGTGGLFGVQDTDSRRCLECRALAKQNGA